jgi:hypothetical protein
MPKAFLPKTIRTDERLKQIFGEPQQQLEQRQEPKPKEWVSFHRADGSPNWNVIREAWKRKQQPKICANPNCLKEYLSRGPTQRFCTPQCYERFRRNGKPIDPEKTRFCECGRYSNHLALGRDGKLKCSFCMETESKFYNELRVIKHRKARLEATKKRREEARIQRLGEKKAKLLEQQRLKTKYLEEKLRGLTCLCIKCGSKCSEMEIALFNGLCINCYFQRCLKKA